MARKRRLQRKNFIPSSRFPPNLNEPKIISAKLPLVHPSVQKLHASETLENALKLGSSSATTRKKNVSRLRWREHVLQNRADLIPFSSVIFLFFSLSLFLSPHRPTESMRPRCHGERDLVSHRRFKDISRVREKFDETPRYTRAPATQRFPF